MSQLLLQIADLYAAETIACNGILASAAEKLRRISADAPLPEPAQQLPVCAQLAAAVAAAHAGPFGALAEAFATYAAGACWRQNASYTAETIGPTFLAGYGYVELVGCDRPWQSDRLAVGFLLLGRHVRYPAHHHPAAEVYHVVSGVAGWRQGHDGLMPKPPGCAIYHAPQTVHETQVHCEPLLALYCWSGNIEVAAELC